MENKDLLKINKDGFITHISPNAIDNGVLHIPKHYKGQDIKGIKGIAISDEIKRLLKRVSFDGNITVETRAFEGCPNLSFVSFSGSADVHKLGFANNPNLLVVVFNSKGETNFLADGSFSNCGIKELEIQENTETDIGAFANNPIIKIYLHGSNIVCGDNTFSDCRELTSIFCEENCNVVYKNGVFANCHNLEEHENTHTIAAMGSRVFADCSKFHGDADKTFVVTGKVDTAALEGTAIENLIYKTSQNIPKNFIRNNEKLTTVSVYGNVSAIKSSAFENCKNNSEIHLPSSLKHIENNAFFKNENIHTVNVLTKLGMFIKQYSSMPELLNKQGIIELPRGVELGENAFPLQYNTPTLKNSSIKINFDNVSFDIKDVTLENLRNQYDTEHENQEVSMR